MHAHAATIPQQMQQDAEARIADLHSTLEVAQADGDSLRELLVQAELQRREAERAAAAAAATAAAAHHRCVFMVCVFIRISPGAHAPAPPSRRPCCLLLPLSP
jgi:hypothetical protein